MADASRVLAIVDPASDSQSALARGIRFAAGLRTPLEVLVVVYNQFVEHDERARTSLLNRQREAAEALVETERDKVDDVSIEVRWGRPLADEVIKRTKEVDPVLVIKDTHHHSALRKTLLSNSDWDLIRGCPAPLVLAKDRDLAAKPGFLAAIDPTKDHGKPESLDQTILSLAKRLSDCLGGSLWPLHVLDTTVLAAAEPVGATMAQAPTVMPTMVNRMPAEELDRLKDERRKLLDTVLTTAGIEPESGTLHVGDPAIGLVECAENHDSDFVVMGAVARGMLDRILIGHTAEQILDRLPCDMIVVKGDQVTP